MTSLELKAQSPYEIFPTAAATLFATDERPIDKNTHFVTYLSNDPVLLLLIPTAL